MPLLPNLNIRGLNIFSVATKSVDNDSDPMTNAVNIDGSRHPTITVVINKTRGLKWIYGPWFFSVPREGKDVIWLSHWKLGNLLKGGDEMSILIYAKSDFKVKECGIQLVYYDDKDQERLSSTQLVASTTDDRFFSVDDPYFLRAGVSLTVGGSLSQEGIIYLCIFAGITENIDLIRDINEKSGMHIYIFNHLAAHLIHI